MMIPTFIKLLAISMVANSCFGFCRKFSIRFDFLVFCLLISSRSAGLSAKKATSAPEISAEVARSTSKINKEMIVSVSIGFKSDKVTMGSRSKVFRFS